MTLTSKVTFFDLPTEIRNEIYLLVAYHHETGGIISPLGGKDHPKVSIGLLDNRRYPIEHRQDFYSIRLTTDPDAERLERKKFNATTNAKSKHFCTQDCLLPPSGISTTCHQLREEVLAVFYGVHTFHFEMSNFEITDSDGLHVRSWSPVQWWRAIGDTNLRRITSFNLVCHPTSKEVKEVTISLRYRWVGKEIEVCFVRSELLYWEKIWLAGQGRRSNGNIPTSRHPSDMSRYETYRMQKFIRGGDFEGTIEPVLSTLQTSGLHVRALEQIVAALEPWDAEYLHDHISLGDFELVMGIVREGRVLAIVWATQSLMAEIAGPVHVITGARDIVFCGGNCLAPPTGYSSIPAAAIKAFPNAETFKATIIPGSGHGLNFEYSWPVTYHSMNNFLVQNGCAPKNG